MTITDEPHQTSRKSETYQAIMYNDKIEDKLHVVMVISNPCEYKRRYYLAREFQNRMMQTQDVILYVVELVYKGQTFALTDEKNPRHLQLRCDIPLWHKENMINMGVKYLLPSNYKAFAWIDADLEFENPFWADHTLRILNGSKDIIQLFSHAEDLNKEETPMHIFTSLGYNYDQNKLCYSKGSRYNHPGYAWAMTRKAYERIGGLFEFSILGSADHNMSQAILGNSNSISDDASPGYFKKIELLTEKMNGLRLGYVPGTIRHFFHGTKENRKYTSRWKILIKYNYDPFIHVTKNQVGILVPTITCPKGLLNEIFNYFHERKEDD